MKVEIYTLDQQANKTLAGTVELVDGKLVATPVGDYARMLRYLTVEYHMFEVGRRIHSKKQPEIYLRCLHRHIHSPYCWATSPMD